MKEAEYIQLTNKVKLDSALKLLGDTMFFNEDRESLAEAFNIIDALREKTSNDIDIDIEP